MKQFDAFSVYQLGKQLFPVLQLDTQQTYKLGQIMWPLWTAREGLVEHLDSGTLFLDASKRAAEAAVAEIDRVLPRDLVEVVKDEKRQEDIYSFWIQGIVDAIKNLETVLGNDMPGLSCYIVSQVGIFKTDDLITKAENYFPEEIRKDVPPKTKDEFNQAGKCLAYQVPTASAFHLWRAVECVMSSYYLKLKKKTFEDDKVTRNWDAYIKALNAAGADTNITKYLDHIRSEYRNPQTHPEELVTQSEAQGLFGAGASAIHQMVLEMQKLS